MKSSHRYTGFITDDAGVEHDITFRFNSYEESQSHPFGSTTATESWTEVDDESYEFTLDDEEIEKPALEAQFPNLDFDKLIDEWIDKAKEV